MIDNSLNCLLNIGTLQLGICYVFKAKLVSYTAVMYDRVSVIRIMLENVFSNVAAFPTVERISCRTPHTNSSLSGDELSSSVL